MVQSLMATFDMTWLARVWLGRKITENTRSLQVGKNNGKKVTKHERNEVNLKLLDFKANVIFNEKHVGTLCGYSKHIGRTEFLGANKEGICENVNFLE